MPRTAAVPAVKQPKQKRVPVTEANLRRTAARLLRSGLVSPEVAFLQRELGASATQETLDAKVLAVRSMPWASLVVPD